jgi:hypothetical protein
LTHNLPTTGQGCSVKLLSMLCVCNWQNKSTFKDTIKLSNLFHGYGQAL